MIDEPSAQGPPFGRYRLIEKIARGGMAEVFKAKSFGVEGFEKVLVIKRIVPELAEQPTFVDMFVQEAKLAVRLSHANIVQVFDLGRVERPDGSPQYYIAMEYVAGVDLALLLEHHRRHRDPIPIGLAVFVAAEIAKALDHAHRRTDTEDVPLGIVHRDISPHNVLLSWDGDVKVTDFGIARAVEAIDSTKNYDDELLAVRTTGKIPFMSPEQSRSDHSDPRGDLFSLGTVLYQLLAGANPFAANDDRETIRRIQAGEYPPLSLARSDAPPALVAIVDDLLRVDPNERLQTAAELHERLVAFSFDADQRFGSSELANHLVAMRESSRSMPRGPDTAADIAAESVLEEPRLDADRTPVEIPQASSPPPSASEATAGEGERREVTMLVLDLGDASGDPSRKSHRMRDLVERHGGWIEETSDHQIVALFGLGDTDGRDAEAAVRTALVLVRERRDGGVPSAGIHSGPISVDDGGLPVSDERLLALMATGQRLARASEGQVVVSPVTARLVRRAFVSEPLPSTLRAVADGGLVVRRAASQGSARGRFVGRTEELKQLGGILAAATRGKPQLVVVRGETGLGKTRLLEEAKRRLERGQFNVAMYTSACPLNGAGIAWSGLRAMLHVLCGTQEDDDPARIREVRPRLRALGLKDDQADQVLRLLGARVKRQGEDSRPVLRASFLRMVQSLSRDRLHCFAWDDAQAIDRESLDTILRLFRERGNTPTGPNRLRAVFILSQRGELPPILTRRKDLHLIQLTPLNESHTSRLLESLLGARTIPAELLSMVHSGAGGHPLFIDELVRELVEQGVVQVLNSSVQLRPDAQAIAPRTLRTLIADRVSRLQQRERGVLQGLATLGEPAFTPMLASVLEQSLPGLDRHLTRLEDKGLVRRTGPTQVRFASPLYQEIVLDAMATPTLQDLNHRAALAYQDAQLPGPGEGAYRTAEHLVHAGRRQEAVDHFWRAAEEQTEADAIEAALRSMMRGLESAEPSERRVEQIANWVERVAGAVDQVRHCPGLEKVLLEPLRQIDARGSDQQRIRAHIHVAHALGSMNLFSEAYQILEFADPERLDDLGLKRESLTAEAYLATRQGDHRRAITAVESLEALGVPLNESELLTQALAKAMVGEAADAKLIMERVEQTEPEDVLVQVMRQKHWLLVHFNLRDFGTAAKVALELSNLARAAGLRFDAAAALHNLGDIHYRLGDPSRAYVALQESLELTRQLEHERLTNLNLMHLCVLEAQRGDEEAEGRLKQLIRYADGRGFMWDVLEGRYLLARLAGMAGRKKEALEMLEEVIEMVEESGQQLIRADARDLKAELDAED
ncbi:MAG: protein kinase [Myxococcota bacterium]